MDQQKMSDRKKRANVRKKVAFISLLLVLSFLVLYVIQYHLGGREISSPQFNIQAVMLVTLTVINVLFIIVLFLVLARYLIKSFFEKKGKLIITSVKAKLIIAFMGLSIVPAALFIFLAVEVINESVNQWFSAPAQEILSHSEELAKETYDIARLGLQQTMQNWLDSVKKGSDIDVDHLRKRLNVDAIFFLSIDGVIKRKSMAENCELCNFYDPLFIIENSKVGKVNFYIENHPSRDVLFCFSTPEWDSNTVVVFAKKFPQPVSYRVFLINEAYTKYKQLKGQVKIIKTNYIFMVVFAGLVLLFGFVWLGIFLSKKITVPINALVDGSHRIAGGDLETPIECEADDEFELLINSFNSMMFELKRNRMFIESAHKELLIVNRELKHRNSFIQTVLDTIATGVVSVDKNFTITICNNSAKNLLMQRNIETGKTHLKDVVPDEKLEEIFKLIHETEFRKKVSREINFRLGKREMHFAVTATLLRDESGKIDGYVVVFDDVSELIKSEKAAAWQEVARRLAHEIKNPLTPIQLSLERIRKQYKLIIEKKILKKDEDVEHFRQILDESINTVRSEISILKYLIEEFSNFARLPVPALRPFDLEILVGEIVQKYKETTPQIDYILEADKNVPAIYADKELISRVISNLFDNAIESIQEMHKTGTINVSTTFDEKRKSVILTIQDSGMGIDDEIMQNLFLPYFSTKEEGMGLGLSIVKKIIDDHGASIKVENIQPHGCKFQIEFTKIRPI